MAKLNKIDFVVDIDGKQVALTVTRPNERQQNEAQLHYLKAFGEALKSNGILRVGLEKHLRDNNLWDDEKEKSRQTLINLIDEKEKKLVNGRIKFSEAEKIAKELKNERFVLKLLLAQRNQLDGATVDAHAENAKFNMLVCLCTVYTEKGGKFFADYADYSVRADEPATLEAAKYLAYLLHNLHPDYEKNLPENRFLLKYKKVRPGDYKFVDAAGKVVDEDGKQIDDEGYRLDPKTGHRIDLKGNTIDETGNLVSTEEGFGAFLDEEGNPLPE